MKLGNRAVGIVIAATGVSGLGEGGVLMSVGWIWFTMSALSSVARVKGEGFALKSCEKAKKGGDEHDFRGVEYAKL